MNNETVEWQQHIGTVWASLLAHHSLNLAGIIVEIAPGFTDKIGLGLAKLNFRGTLYIVEPNNPALEWALHQYRQLMPTATIIGVNKCISDAATLLPKVVDAILMNHILDDLVLHAALPSNARENVFSQIKPGGPCLHEVKNAWQQLLANPEYLASTTQKVLMDLYRLIDHVDANFVGISQYKSLFLQQNELQGADLVGNNLLREISLRFSPTSLKDIELLANVGQRAEDWLFITTENIPRSPESKLNYINRLTTIED